MGIGSIEGKEQGGLPIVMYMAIQEEIRYKHFNKGFWIWRADSYQVALETTGGFKKGKRRN